MGELNPTESKMPAVQPDNTISIPAKGKTLYIKPDTKKFDYPSMLNQFVQYVSMADILAKIKVGTQYVVQIPTEYQQPFDAGDLFMMQNQKTGKMWPSLMEIAENGRHQVVTPLPVAEQDFIQGNPIQDLANGYHNLVMQQQMEQLSAKLDTVLDAVKRIEQGQIDDRFAKFESGKNSLILALYIKNSEAKTQQLNSSRAILSLAQCEIGQALKRRVEDFEPLPKNVFKLYGREVAKEGYFRSKDCEFQLIQEYYDYYLQATKFIAVSFAMSGEMDAAKQTYQLAETFLSSIDFSRLKTIEHVHKNLKDMFYSMPVQYLSVEKQICFDEMKAYDYVALEVSGNKLLEVLSNGGSEEVSESNTEQ